MRNRTRDFVDLTKPAVTRMCLLTTLGGFLLAPTEFSTFGLLVALVGAGLAVASANVFNMWWERDTDALMSRTRRRPLPAGRMQPGTAFKFAVVLAIASVLVLWLGANALTALIAVVAIALYVLVYTPLKRITPAALFIGAIPGAVPPLLGWTAATGSIDAPAVVLFSMLLIWQMPHFIAISLYRKAEYARAGIQVLPVARGDAVAKIQAVAWSMLLIPSSLLLGAMGIGANIYMTTALLLSTGFLAWSFTGLSNSAGPKWARGFFLASLVYIPALSLALVADALM